MASFGFHTTGKEVVETFRQQAEGKTIVITGASKNGLGAETAITFASASPSKILLLARSASKVDPVIEQIHKIDPRIEVSFVSLELDKFDSIRQAAAEIDSKISQLDILVNNAGIMATPYSKSPEGLESQLATNHVGHFYLTKLLLPKVLKAGKENARIVNVTSDGYMLGPFRFDDYNFSDGKTYDVWSGYGQSKTANILFTRHLARNGYQSFAVHPGVIGSTSISADIKDRSIFNELTTVAKRNTGFSFEMGQPKSVQQGVATTCVASLDTRMSDKSGSYLVDCNIDENIRDYAASYENAAKLWKLSEELIGEKFEL